MGGNGAVLEAELELARESVGSARTVILVEGESDRRALEVLAERKGRLLSAERAVIIAIAGAGNLGRFLELLPEDVRVSGLYDQAEEPILRRALVTSGVVAPDSGDLENAGFFRCSRDLEDELIRAVGVPGVLEVITREGDSTSWERFSRQPAQRDRSVEARLRRFLGTRSGRKIEYAGLLAASIDSAASDTPLDRLLTRSLLSD